MRAAGIVDIHDKDSTIAVHLVYATPYNFMGKVLYDDMSKAFMIEDMAERFVKANRLLKSIRPDVNLLIYDACRPISVQWDMWELVKGTDKEDFVANPELFRQGCEDRLRGGTSFFRKNHSARTRKPSSPAPRDDRMRFPDDNLGMVAFQLRDSR